MFPSEWLQQGPGGGGKKGGRASGSLWASFQTLPLSEARAGPVTPNPAPPRAPFPGAQGGRTLAIATCRAGWGTSTIMGLRTHAGPGSLRHGEKLQPAPGLVPENTGPRRLWGTEVGLWSQPGCAHSHVTGWGVGMCFYVSAPPASQGRWLRELVHMELRDQGPAHRTSRPRVNHYYAPTSLGASAAMNIQTGPNALPSEEKLPAGSFLAEIANFHTYISRIPLFQTLPHT